MSLTKVYIVSILFISIGNGVGNVASASKLLYNNLFHPNIPEDGRLDFPGLARKYGRHCEAHEVTTDDGYILTVFHVPASQNHNDIPMLLMHGVLDSCDTFIIRANISLVFNLTAAGYDVWVGNFRGNKYARGHVTLNPDTDKRFWNFSITEQGYYDYAATIDYVLNKTGNTKVNVIAHSLGTANLFILASTRPEFNDKINALIALAPIAYLQHLKGPTDILIKLVWPLLDTTLALQGIEEIFNENSILREFVEVLCTQQTGYEICIKGILFSVIGSDPEEIGPVFSPVLFGHYPAAVSRKLVNHLTQIVNNKRFAHYDYGSITNKMMYGSLQPPKYDLSKVKTKVVLMVGQNDYLSPPEDAKLLNASLPNVDYFMMPRKSFNHDDFVWSKDMPTILYPYMYNFIDKYCNKMK